MEDMIAVMQVVGPAELARTELVYVSKRCIETLKAVESMTFTDDTGRIITGPVTELTLTSGRSAFINGTPEQIMNWSA